MAPDTTRAAPPPELVIAREQLPGQVANARRFEGSIHWVGGPLSDDPTPIRIGSVCVAVNRSCFSLEARSLEPLLSNAAHATVLGHTTFAEF